jgi:hypothetical protein
MNKYAQDQQDAIQLYGVHQQCAHGLPIVEGCYTCRKSGTVIFPKGR